MNLEVLVSTMNQMDIKLLIERMNIKTNSVIINQCNYDNEENIIIDNNIKVNIISNTERGLSKSRNLALSKARADICLIADDDLEYVDNYEKIIINEFEKNPEYDILIFKVEGKNGVFKKYSNSEKKLNFISVMKVASVQMAFRRHSIVSNKIEFNEEFGSGSNYRMGEESILLFNCLRKKLKIKYIPIKIADLYLGDSTWFNGFNKEYFYCKGACFQAMSNRLVLLFILQFAIRKYKLYKSETTFFNSIINMYKGSRDYKNKIKRINKIS